ncbi:MAG: ferrochelatase [Spirochaetia bacterium]|nr:ferrochelatase [Spirochaetia bacterium]
MKTGVLLINTGSPESPDARDVKKYLQEFLMDERVIDIPAWKRKLLVYGIIAPFRSKKVSRLYNNIWTSKGSPLVAYTHSLSKLIAKSTMLPTEYAMRYGDPSIQNAIKSLADKKIKTIIVVPMFPHYAMSTYESVIEKVKNEMKAFSDIKIKTIKPYYNHPDYINSLYENSKKYFKNNFDHIIFSYHSLPIRHIYKTDDTKNTCLKFQNCCDIYNPAHEKCYKAQVLQTTKLFIKKAKLNFEINSKKLSLTYQSAMRGDWLKPSTEEKIVELARNGYKNVLIICPGFVTDNLETIEEICIRGRNSFLSNFVSTIDVTNDKSKQKKIMPEFTFIPSLNLNKTWVKTLSKWIRDEI